MKKIDPKSPYNKKSGYGKLFAYWKKVQVTTRSAMIAEALRIGMTEKAARASVGVILSPRKSDDIVRGVDCLGNISARGEYYYADKLIRKEGEEQRFRLRYRAIVLSPKTRHIKEEVKAVKVKVKTKVKTKARTKVEVAGIKADTNVAKADVVS